eukprot:scaffold6081_cov101-Cylindrotheca_fusiformis.AAC.4
MAKVLLDPMTPSLLDMNGSSVNSRKLIESFALRVHRGRGRESEENKFWNSCPAISGGIHPKITKMMLYDGCGGVFATL